jgi:opacity protein-like surface antigen
MTTNNSKTLALLVSGLLWASFAQAQESANASGGNAIGSGGSSAYSVGQVIYTTNTGNNSNVDQGVQHSIEILSLSAKETSLNISLTVFPNPTTENLTLQINDFTNEKLTYQLFDMQGKQFSNREITAQQTHINMNSLPTATYFINVVNQENKKVKSFKIIKN